MFGIVAVTFSGLAGQLGNLTLRQEAAYRNRAVTQSTREIAIPAPRGTIYDRNMQPLAINRPAYRLLVDYPYYKDATVLGKLSEILGLPIDKIEQQVKKQADLPFEPVSLVDDLTPQQHTAILEQKQELPGVVVQAEAVRQYPAKELAAQALGYVGSLSEQELEDLKANGYRNGDQIGKTGLEAFYENELRGKNGVRQIEVNSYAQPLAEIGRTEPESGHNLVLTLDAKIQKSAERALDWQMHRLQTIPNLGDGHAYPNAKAGAVVVIDVKTGAIRAMASRPAFDPNLFVGGISTKDWRRLSDDPFIPLLNRAVQAEYHPGSTWKMLSGTAAVTAGVTDPYERVFSGAVYEPTGQKDWLPGGHGWVDLRNALRLSSDIYFYEMGIRLGIEKEVEFAKKFGFGALTGVDLGEEVKGFLPDEEYRTKNGWWLGQTASAAIGQIFTVTPVQLARYVAALANGGKMMKPYLVQSVQDNQGKMVRETAPQVTGTLPISQATLSVAIDGMKLVNSPTGTSDFAQWPLPGMATAGKTGTAENPPQDDYGLYVGFAPADNPELAVAVVIEQAGHGGSVSTVARTIWADYYGIKLPAGDPARVPDNFEAN
jgi:penicillin-binding protein 2